MRPGVQPPGREARRESGSPSALAGLLFSIMLLGGLVLVLFGARDLVDLVNSPSSNRHADGVVIRVDTVTCGSGSNSRRCYRPVVRFVTAREEVIEFTSNLDWATASVTRSRFATIPKIRAMRGLIHSGPGSDPESVTASCSSSGSFSHSWEACCSGV